MDSSAYTLGVLDALVKAGEMSPAYAAGVADVLAKEAAPFWDHTAQLYQNAYDEFRQAHPERIRPDGTLDIRPDEAKAIADKSQNWYDQIGPDAGWGNWIRNRWNKYVWRHMPGVAGKDQDAGYYDRELTDMENKARHDRLQRSGVALHPAVAGALQDAHMRDARFRVEDAKRWMLNSDREAAGLTDDYVDKYRTAAGDAAVAGGVYKPKYHKPVNAGPQKATYGKDLPSSYGANKHMFYRVGYMNPLAQQ